MAHNTATRPAALARFAAARLREESLLAEAFDAPSSALLDAQIEALRLYVSFLTGESTTHDPVRDCGLLDGLETAVELIAMGHASHPDYRQEWSVV